VTLDQALEKVVNDETKKRQTFVRHVQAALRILLNGETYDDTQSAFTVDEKRQLTLDLRQHDLRNLESLKVDLVVQGQLVYSATGSHWEKCGCGPDCSKRKRQ